jgi:phosphate transport system substrate-binding protein
MTRAVCWLLFVSTAVACGRGKPELSGVIKIDGSSTVSPLTTAAVKAFAKPHPAVQISVNVSGTSGGFERFCRGETEIENASRAINARERAACEQGGVSFIEVPVAQDAVTVIVHPSNDWVKSVSLADLKKMWEPAAQRKVKQWSDIRSDWPSQPLHLFGPGAQSGTFDFFTEAIVGTVDASRRDYTASEDDQVILKRRWCRSARSWLRRLFVLRSQQSNAAGRRHCRSECRSA